LAVVSSDLAAIFPPVPIALVIRPVTLIDNVPAATVGVETAIDLTHHFAVVPELRAHVFSLSSGATSGFAIRPGVAVLVAYVLWRIGFVGELLRRSGISRHGHDTSLIPPSLICHSSGVCASATTSAPTSTRRSYRPQRFHIDVKSHP